jgi:hypothetical protein
LTSGYFAQAPALNDPFEYAQEEMLQMLQTVLPDDMALVSFMITTHFVNYELDPVVYLIKAVLPVVSVKGWRHTVRS